MTYQDAVQIARGGEGAIVAMLLRLDGQLRIANKHNAYLHLQVDEICRLQVEKFALETSPVRLGRGSAISNDCRCRECKEFEESMAHRETALTSVRSKPSLADWGRKIQTVNRRSEHYNSLIETLCTKALSSNKVISGKGSDDNNKETNHEKNQEATVDQS